MCQNAGNTPKRAKHVQRMDDDFDAGILFGIDEWYPY